MSFPALRPGLVISYSYLWAREHQRGAEEGLKNRPCAIVAARQIVDGVEIATVVPITHTAPQNPDGAIEMPSALKAYLGLDEHRSWIVVTEVNSFIWPGPDLRPIGVSTPHKFDYGMLPPRFFAHLQSRLLHAMQSRRLKAVRRSE